MQSNLVVKHLVTLGLMMFLKPTLEHWNVEQIIEVYYGCPQDSMPTSWQQC